MDDRWFRLGDRGRYPTSLNMSQYTKIIEAIAEQTDGEFRAASKEDLASLKGLGLPSTVIDFFAEHEPDGCIEGAERLWPISEILVENTKLVPGCNIMQHGYVVFSTTGCGDTFCFDLNNQSSSGEPRVVFMSHEEDYESMTPKQVHSMASPVAQNLLEFLDLFARDALYDE